MKKFLFALVLGLILVLALASTVSADNGPHGRFNGSTQACASCHRAHAGQSAGDMLLTASDVWSLCTSCHDGTGAYTNVVDGYYDDGTASAYGQRTTADDAGKTNWSNTTGQPNMGLFGGGFVHARMMTDYGTNSTANTQTATTNTGNTYWTGTATDNINASQTSWAVLNQYDPNSTLPTGRDVTSAHKVGQTFLTPFTGSSVHAGTVWGGGTYVNSGLATASAAAAGTLELECTSCHTPHGAGGRVGGLDSGAPTPSYRLLEFSPEGTEKYELPRYVSTTISGIQYVKLFWDMPSVNGVTVPDSSTYWYTPNTDVTFDGSLVARAGSKSGTELGLFTARFAGRGDYGGIYYAYRMPAVVGGTSGSSSRLSYITCTTPPSTTASTGLGGCGVSTAGVTWNNTPAQDVMGFWCATCHDRYLAPGGGSNGATTNPNPNVQAGVGLPNGGSRTTDSGDVAYHYRHRSQGVAGSLSTVTGAGFSPYSYNIGADSLFYKAGSYGGGQYTCLSCHNAHGTVAQMTAFSMSATYSNSSALLKADNRAICLRCHAGTVNFFNTVTTPGASMVYPTP